MKTKIIVEIASSHNGDLEMAKALIRSASLNGADIIKFQDWRSDNVPENDPDKKRYELYQFKDEWYPILIDYCKEYGVEFLTTCFNVDRCKFLAELGLKKIKLASISLTNTELLMQAGLYFDEVILSTGMANKEEIENAIDILSSNTNKFTIMGCIANYPMNIKEANLYRLGVIDEMLKEQEYGTVGYSDHALDLDVAKAVLCLNIKYLEKHFSLSRDLPQIKHQMYKDGPLLTTHEISINPEELLELSKWRDKVEIMKGNKTFEINEIEEKIKSRYLKRYGV